MTRKILFSIVIKMDHLSPQGLVNITTHFVLNLKIETNMSGKNLKVPSDI